MAPYIVLTIPSYAALAFVGGFFALCFTYFRLERFNIKFTQFLFLFAIGAVGLVIGSKVLFALTQIPWLIENFSFANLLLLIPQSGFVFYGGLFGLIFTLLFLTRKDINYRKNVFRMVVPAMPLFHGFGRIGCLMAGCCYGELLSEPIEIGLVVMNRIPIQAIEALAEFLLFAALLIVDRIYKDRDIDLLRIYLLSYALIRFTDEFFRGDLIRGIYFGLSTAQWISLAIVITYAVKLIKGKVNLKKA